jgi:Spy/CpxP family protein refolding chaperone
MNTIRFYKGVIIALILLNLGSLSFLWLGRTKGDQSANQGQAAEFLIRELKLTPGQQEQFGTMRSEHRERLNFIQEHDRNLHNKFFEPLFLPTPDTTLVKSLADSIANLRREMELITFSHFMQLKQILSASQKEKFHNIFREALDRVMPPPPPLKKPGK